MVENHFSFSSPSSNKQPAYLWGTRRGVFYWIALPSKIFRTAEQTENKYIALTELVVQEICISGLFIPATQTRLLQK